MSIVFLLLFALLSIVVTVSLFSQYQAFAQGTETSGYSSYENYDGGFTIDYPSDWQVDDNNPAIFTPPSYTLTESQKVQVVVTAIDDPVSSSLQGFTNFEFNYLRSEADGFRLYQSYSSTLAGLPAYVLVYGDNGFLSDELETGVVIYAISAQGALYKIEYSASPNLYSSYLPIANNMIKTFRFTDTSSPDAGGTSSGNGGSSGGCPTPGPGGCNGAFSQGPGAFSPLNPNYGQIPLQQNVPEFDPNNP